MKTCAPCPLCMQNRLAFLPQIVSHDVTSPQQSCLGGTKADMTGEVPKVPQAQSTVLLSPPQVQSCVGYLVAHLCLTGNERDVLGAFNLIKQTRVTTEKGTVPQDRVGIVAWSGFVITKTPCPPPSCFLPQFMCQLTQKTRF